MLSLCTAFAGSHLVVNNTLGGSRWSSHQGPEEGERVSGMKEGREWVR